MIFDPPEGKAVGAFPSGGSKVIRGIIARKEGEPGNEAKRSHLLELRHVGKLVLLAIVTSWVGG